MIDGAGSLPADGSVHAFYSVIQMVEKTVQKKLVSRKVNSKGEFSFLSRTLTTVPDCHWKMIKKYFPFSRGKWSCVSAGIYYIPFRALISECDFNAIIIIVVCPGHT